MTEIGVTLTAAGRRSSVTKKNIEVSDASSGAAASTQVQIIDFDGKFCVEFEEHLTRLGISKCGLKYNVVAVLGCQSSGKSTLLNSMFATSFLEMNAMEGRHQTTKGIWVAKDYATDTLIVDVEGTDSRERGENRLTFEHRASLFSLAVADAVIVNMWYQDLGRYAASNYGLLKTVLAVNLELFQQEIDTKKTTMIFVIRDYSPELTPLHKLNEMLLTDIVDIWNDIKKPAELSRSSASDFFKFVVVGMPSKITSPVLYEKEVASLRKRWLEKEAPSTYTRNVPADGFAFYAQVVWDAIVQSAELDIPSQKEMVATYRCEEIRQTTLAEVIPWIQSAAEEPTKLFVDKIAEKAIVEAIEMYHRDAWRYQENIYTKKKEQLLESLYNEIQRPLEKFLFSTKQNLIRSRTKEVEIRCKRDEWNPALMADGQNVIEFWEKLGQTLADWLSRVMSEFDEVCNQAAIDCVLEIEAQPQPVNYRITHVFETEIVRKTLEEGLEGSVARIISKENTEFRKYLSNEVDNLRIDIEVLYNETVLDREKFWTLVGNLCHVKIPQLEEKFGKALEGITALDQEIKVLSPRDRFTVISVMLLKESLIKRIEWLPELIHRRFLKFFESDDKGVPYFWASLSQEKIRSIYLDAREEAERLLPIISVFDLDVSKLVSDQNLTINSSHRHLQNSTIISETKKSDIAAQAAKRMLKSCQEAQFIQATGGKVSTPAWWWWGLLLILGWNEFMSIVHHPIFVFVILMLACLGGATWYTGNVHLMLNTARNFTSLVLSFIIPILTSFQEGGAAHLARNESS